MMHQQPIVHWEDLQSVLNMLQAVAQFFIQAEFFYIHFKVVMSTGEKYLTMEIHF